MIKNNENIAKHLFQIADMLEMTEDEIDAKKCFGYRKAAQTIETYPIDVTTINEPTTIKGIGQSTGQVIQQFIQGNTSQKYQELLKQTPPPSVFELTKLDGIGIREAKILYQSYGIKNFEDLGDAIDQTKIRDPKIIEAFRFYERQSKRILYQDAYKIVGPIFEALQHMKEVKKISFVGSMRRSRPTVADADILCIATDRNKIVDYFCSWNEGNEDQELIKELDMATITVKGFKINLIFCEEEQWGGELFYLTGPKEFNLRNITVAKSKQMSLSEYGVAIPTGKVIGETEEKICETIGVPYYVPELRELATSVRLPRLSLISKEDVTGDTHVHTSMSEGASGSPENYARGAIELGYKYLVLTDSTKDVEKFKRQHEEIDKINEWGRIRLIKGIEVDILPKGNLSYENKILEQFDIVTAAIHSSFDLEVMSQTARLVEAIRHSAVKIIAHPECSVYGKQQGIKCNWDTIFDECVRNDVALEISGKPNRIGFAPTWLWRAKKAGVKFVLGSAARSISTLPDISYALIKARRSGIEKEDLCIILDSSNAKTVES